MPRRRMSPPDWFIFDVTAEVDQLELLDAVAALAVCFGGANAPQKDSTERACASCAG